MVPASRWSRRCRPCRCARTDLQRFADRGSQIALPPAPEGSISSEAGSRRGGDRRAERCGHREPAQGHAVYRDGRRHGPGHDRRARGGAARQYRNARPVRFSAALRTPMDRATASQTADCLPKDSGSHSRGFALQSRGATGTTSCAPDPKREERGHGHARCDRHIVIPNARLRTHGKPSCDANLTVATGAKAVIGSAWTPMTSTRQSKLRQAFLGRRGPRLVVCRVRKATSGLLAQGAPGPAGDCDLPETSRGCREVQERRFSSSIRTRLVGAASPQRQSTRLRSVDEAPRAKDGTRSAA
jgi:hypothetical protein